VDHTPLIARPELVAALEAQVTFFDTGHFALETHAAEIADAIRTFSG
jgi:hypothetical protein